MATEVERLLLRMEVSQSRFERQLAKANQTANRRAYSIEQRFRKMNTSVVSSLRGLAAPLAAAFSIDAFRRLTDAATRIDNALKVAGLSGSDLEQVYSQLAASAQRNAAPLESLVELYSRAALVQKELGVSQQELINFTDKVALALRVSGRSAQESSGALLQLSQALGSGVVRAEEFNSILEGALPIAQAAAAGLKEAGGSVSRLRQLVVDGKVSSEAFFRAFEAGSSILNDKVAGATLTTSQAFAQLNTSMTTLVRTINNVVGTSEGIAFFLSNVGRGIDVLAGSVDKLNDVGDRTVLQGLQSDLAALIEKRERYKRLIEESPQFFQPNGPLSKSRALEQIEELNKEADALLSRITQLQGRPSAPVNAGTVRPSSEISLKDFSVAGSRGATKAPAVRSLDDFQREVQLITERTRALEFEQSILGQSTQEVYRAQVAQDLLNAARQAGIPITEGMSALIDQLSSDYARQADALDQLNQKQDEANDRMRQYKEDSKAAFKGLIEDLQAGTSAAEALGNAVKNLIRSLQNRAIDRLFDGLFGTAKSSAGGSIFSSIFGFADGGIAANGRPVALPRFARGGVARSASIFGEAGPEAAVPLPDGRRIPVDLKVPQAGQGGGRIVIDLNPSEAFVSGVANRQIRMASGQIVEVSVRESRKANRKALASDMTDSKSRRKD